MDDITANRIVFFILLVIVIGIILSLQLIIQDSFLDKLKNSSGQFSGVNILMMFGVGILIYLLIAYLFKSKDYRRVPYSTP